MAPVSATLTGPVGSGVGAAELESIAAAAPTMRGQELATTAGHATGYNVEAVVASESALEDAGLITRSAGTATTTE